MGNASLYTTLWARGGSLLGRGWLQWSFLLLQKAGGVLFVLEGKTGWGWKGKGCLLVGAVHGCVVRKWEAGNLLWLEERCCRRIQRKKHTDVPASFWVLGPAFKASCTNKGGAPLLAGLSSSLPSHVSEQRQQRLLGETWSHGPMIPWRGTEVPDQGTTRFSIWWKSASWFADTHEVPEAVYQTKTPATPPTPWGQCKQEKSLNL